jgi:lysophospholipase L1-like esterase
MKIAQIILFTVTAFAGCTENAKTAASIKTDSATANTKTMTDSTSYLALGDSYTIGESVPQAQSYPYQLVNLLNQNSLKLQDPHIIAVTGWTTDDLINAIDQSDITNKKFDVVTLLIGVNDQYQQLSKDNYRTKFIQVLHTAIKFAKGDKTRVFVISIPDWGVTPFADGQDSVIGPVIDQFNAINKAESVKAGVNYIDITDISRQATTDPALVAEDGLHPSGKMYSEWVKRIEPLVAGRLKKQG